MEGFSAWDGTAFTQTMIFIPDSAANILNTPSGARAWSREGTGPYSLKSLLQLPSHLNPLGTQLITPHFANFSEVEAHFRQRRISLRLSLKSRRKACASLFTSIQLRNPRHEFRRRNQESAVCCSLAAFFPAIRPKAKASLTFPPPG